MDKPRKTEVRDIFIRLANGNEGAFQHIFDNYRRKLHFVALKTLKSPHLAEEVVQDVLMAVWVNQAKFHQIKDPEGYIFRMLFNRVSLELKKIASDEDLIKNILPWFKDETVSAEELFLVRENQSLIDEAIEELPPQRKIIFKLSRQEGLTNEEIALQLNISRNTVKNQLGEALRNIRTYVDGAWLIYFLLSSCDQLNPHLT